MKLVSLKIVLSFIRNVRNEIHHFFLGLVFFYFPNDYFMLFSSFFLENFFDIIFIQRHLLVQTWLALTHVAATNTCFEAFAVISITLNFFAATSSCVQHFTLSFVFYSTIFLLKRQRIDFFRLLNDEISHVCIFLVI